MITAPRPPEFLTAALAGYNTGDNDTRPRVTLTFAQSLDAKIAGRNGKQLILSGTESMVMTHWMRTMHDAILVGIGTALNDDPQLNTRHLPPPASPDTRHHLPRPIILDSRLRLPPTCKLLANYRAGTGRHPWVVSTAPPPGDDDPGWGHRLAELERAGARVVRVVPHGDAVGIDTDADADTDRGTATDRLPIPAVLKALRDLGVRSLMVEGGARVIGSFFAGASLVDTVIVTVAPTFVGEGGVGYGVRLGEVYGFQHFKTELMGRDTVVVMSATPATTANV